MKNLVIVLGLIAFSLSGFAQTQIHKSMINYPSSQFKLDDTDKQIIENVYKKYLVNDQEGMYTLAMFGYCDTTGSDELNLKLSEDRVKTAFDYLISIADETVLKRGCIKYAGICLGDQQACTNYIVPMTSEGRGETNCIAYNNTEEGKAMNRRVEIIVYEDQKACIGEVTLCQYPTKDMEMTSKAGSKVIIPTGGLNVQPAFDGKCDMDEIEAQFVELMPQCEVLDDLPITEMGRKTLFDCGSIEVRIAPPKFSTYSCAKDSLKDMLKLIVPLTKRQARENLKAYTLNAAGELESLGGFTQVNADSTENTFEVRLNAKDLENVQLKQEVEMDTANPENLIKVRVRGFEVLDFYAVYDFSKAAVPTKLLSEKKVLGIPHKSYEINNLTSKESIRVVAKGDKKGLTYVGVKELRKLKWKEGKLHYLMKKKDLTILPEGTPFEDSWCEEDEE